VAVKWAYWALLVFALALPGDFALPLFLIGYACLPHSRAPKKGGGGGGYFSFLILRRPLAGIDWRFSGI
jgi:hypothetical protein